MNEWRVKPIVILCALVVFVAGGILVELPRPP